MPFFRFQTYTSDSVNRLAPSLKFCGFSHLSMLLDICPHRGTSVVELAWAEGWVPRNLVTRLHGVEAGDRMHVRKRKTR